MGRIDQTQGTNIVVYTNDRNFLSRDFLRHRKTKTSNTLVDKTVDTLCNDILETQSQKGNIMTHQTPSYPINTSVSTKATTSSEIQKEEEKVHPDFQPVHSANNRREPARRLVSYTRSRLDESTVASEADYILKDMDKKFKTDKKWRKSLVDFLMKMPNYFNKKLENESIKYINALDNLVNQHTGKLEKTLQHPLDPIERENYFLWIRNYLYENKVVSGTIHDFWVK